MAAARLIAGVLMAGKCSTLLGKRKRGGRSLQDARRASTDQSFMASLTSSSVR
jgi:hypothetical protein